MVPTHTRSFTIAAALTMSVSACAQDADRSDSTPTTSLVVTDTVHYADVQNREKTRPSSRLAAPSPTQ